MRPGASRKEIAPLSSVRGYLHVYIHKSCIHSGEVLEVSDPYGLDECMTGREVVGRALKMSYHRY